MLWRPTVLRRAFIAASVAWAVALPLATLAASAPTIPASTYLFALSVYAAGSGVCHQLAQRSFALWGKQMPVCARCTGIYVGGAIAAVVAAFRTTEVVRHTGAAPLKVAQGFSPAGVALVVSALPTVATLVFEWTTGVTPSNGTRAAAGLPIGAAVAWLVVRVLR